MPDFNSTSANKQSDKKPRPKRPADTPDVRLSKSLSWILRHGAVKENLPIRPDGYISLAVLMKHNKFRNSKVSDIARVVKENAKQRFTLTYKPDENLDSDRELKEGENLEDWFIRANQGHSMETVDKVELVPLTQVESFPRNIVHGTSRKAWTKIKESGLSKMNRLHIHMAGGLLGDEGVTSGMRASSEVFIYVDAKKAVDAGIPFFKSSNNVILSPGNAEGIIPVEYFLKVENSSGQPIE